jgi:hypothetical protein
MLFETFLLTKLYKKNERFTVDMLNVLDSSLIIIMVIVFLYSFGAAKLSWSYNNYVGSSFFISLIWSIIAFLFSSMYYPLYGLLLDPVGNLKKMNKDKLNNF